ncbi:hypothetical protein ACFXJ8_08590 [Nonomuraea sp. NPDC059194]|uniref:hypothetical protein n=1 Tax=Nonomuraea sp. NPDC059194 TaxID=3346764 RepID=UPI0036BE0CEE
MAAHSHGWWIILHLALFVFWLGGDLGVFYSSRYVLRESLSVEARTTALKIMSGLDLAPKICLVLFLPSGVTLMALDPHGATLFGVPLFPLWSVILVWAFALGWLALTVVAHTNPTLLVKRADWAIRVGLVAAIGVAALYTLTAAEPFGVETNPRWLGAKLALYAVAIVAGLGIRLTLRSFGPAFAMLHASGSTSEVELRLRRSVDGCLPYVWTIWGSVLAAAILGVLKPGATL